MESALSGNVPGNGSVIPIPRRSSEIDDQLWQIHKDMVEQALEHRARMIELLTSAAASLVNPIK